MHLAIALLDRPIFLQPTTRLFRHLTLWLCLLCGGAHLWAEDTVCPLPDEPDAPLQHRLVALLEREGLSAAVDRGELALSLLILTDPERPRLAQVNGHSMMYAASLPKIAILLGAAVAVDDERLVLDPSLRDDLNNMIRFSCNPCSNRVLDLIGRDWLLALLQSPRFSLYDRQNGGGLWVGKDFARQPAFRRDPVAGLSHAASTFQVARFYCGLQRGTLVSPAQTQLMLAAMSEPGIDHKFVKGLAPREGLAIYRKSGTWKTFHADSALVREGDAVYVMAALAHNPEGGAWLERLAQPLRQLALAPPTPDAHGDGDTSVRPRTAR